MNNELTIKVENLSKSYKLYDKPIDRLKESLNPFKKKYHKGFFAVKDLSFEVKQGETIGIIGKNGSGKSTLLKMITGVLTPTSGNILVNGKISALLELGAGFNPEFTGIENIYLNGTIMGYTKEEMDQKKEDIIQFADIGEFINQPVKTYSSGMFVRLAFAVAINVEPEVLIVDEALSVGDVFFQLKCYKKFEEFKKAGKTILLVTHDLGSITRYCDRAIFLSEGCIVAEGDPRDIVDKYKKSIVGINIDENKNLSEIKTFAEDNSIPWSSYLQVNPNKLDYGNNKAQIVDFAVIDNRGNITNTIEKGKICSFRMKVKFNEDIDCPIFAIAIKDIRGTEITGTNTVLEGIDTGSIKVGDIIEVTFTQEFKLQGGPYFLSLGCTRVDTNTGLEVFHRLYDVVSLEIIQSKVSTGLFDMNSDITIKVIERV
ncbi:MAG: tagH 2 [Clostridiaceae bacterium]|jgi:teichoic acid transport system ATP-binding protein|nr:tagH 2 [Clostridiaceae bacterium]